MLKYAYYPGCSLHGTAREYDASTRLACDSLGIELEELDDWSCCGATPAHNLDRWLGLALPARNLRLAEEAGLGQIAAPCAACFSRLKAATYELREPGTLRQVNTLLDRPVGRLAEVHNLLEVLTRVDVLARLAKAMNQPLRGLKVACYYGCVLVRPPEILGFDDCEHPQTMDWLITALGGEPVPWTHKTKCCGAGMLALGRRDIMLERVREIVSTAVRYSADVIATACPMCHANLDGRQAQVNGAKGTAFHVPILYFTQLVGVALGCTPAQMMFDRHLVDPVPLLRDKGLA